MAYRYEDISSSFFTYWTPPAGYKLTYNSANRQPQRSQWQEPDEFGPPPGDPYGQMGPGQFPGPPPPPDPFLAQNSFPGAAGFPPQAMPPFQGGFGQDEFPPYAPEEPRAMFGGGGPGAFPSPPFQQPPVMNVGPEPDFYDGFDEQLPPPPMPMPMPMPRGPPPPGPRAFPPPGSPPFVEVVDAGPKEKDMNHNDFGTFGGPPSPSTVFSDGPESNCGDAGVSPVFYHLNPNKGPPPPDIRTVHPRQPEARRSESDFSDAVSDYDSENDIIVEEYDFSDDLADEEVPYPQHFQQRHK